jgi:hypothetical protein
MSINRNGLFVVNAVISQHHERMNALFYRLQQQQQQQLIELIESN